MNGVHSYLLFVGPDVRMVTLAASHFPVRKAIAVQIFVIPSLSRFSE